MTKQYRCRGAFYQLRTADIPDFDTLQGTSWQEIGVLYGQMVPAEAGGGTTVPTTVFRGCFPTYSMPVDHAGTAEYVTFEIPIPDDWNQSSDFKLTFWFAQASAETSGEKYIWNSRFAFADYGATLTGTYGEASGTTTLGADGTVQYYNHWLDITIPYQSAAGTAYGGGIGAFWVHMRNSGTIGEALLQACTLGYWADTTSGTREGTYQGKKLLASRV